MPVAEITDLTEDSTKEDVQEYVDQVAKEVESDRAGEEKSDAQITSEHASTQQPDHKEKTAETDSGSDETAEAESQGEDTGNDSEGPEWLTDELKAEAAANGIEESEISDFSSREEVERALRLFDKSALEAGRKALAESESESDKGKTRNEKGQFEKNETPKADDEPVDTKSQVEGQYEIKLDTDLYDEEIVDELTGLRDHYESRMQALESRLVASEERSTEAEEISKERHFDNLVDSLGHADLFGKTDKETTKEKDRRDDLFVEVETYLLGRKALGRPAELTEELMKRISRSIFSEEIGKKELKNRTRKISRQSNGRQGGGATRPQDPRDDPRDAADRLYKEMDGA
jgi:hypothetical protein